MSASHVTIPFTYPYSRRKTKAQLAKEKVVEDTLVTEGLEQEDKVNVTKDYYCKLP